MAELACTDFVTLDEVLAATCACELNEDDHGDLIEFYIADASDILYVLSGGRIHGTCTRTVWPFRVGTTCGPGWGRMGWGAESWVDWDSIDSIPLQGPHTTILEVTIDGVVLDPTEYGLLDGNKLFRKSGVWPSDNDITLADTEEGTFTITYSFGLPTNAVIRRAVVELVCSMVAGDSQALTRLRGIVSANVQGVSVTMGEDVDSAGLPELSRFMSIYAPYGMGARGVYSPELSHGWRLLAVTNGSGS